MERTFRSDDALERELLRRLRSGERVALAVVVEASGSTPQVPGAAALFTTRGLVAGTVGGGSAEARTERAALRALRDGTSALLTVALAGDVNVDADGICGGRMRVLVDGDPGRDRAAFERLCRESSRRRPGLLAVFLNRKRGGRGFSVRRAWLPSVLSPAALRAAGLLRLRGEAAAVLAEKHARFLARPSGFLYLEPRFPAPRLVIAGAGHVGRAVARLGVFLGFAVQVVDDRAEFASAERFPDAERIFIDDPAAAVRLIPADPGTFIVIVTRGHARDAAVLRACVRRRLGYIGMIGSARKIELLRREFLARGWASAGEWERIHAPIGLPIGSKTVEEIAVSIAAELVAVRRSAR